jgi:NADH-quinone oxidoreductase subunit L
MRAPLVILAVFAAVAGFFDVSFLRHGIFAGWLQPVFAHSLYADHESTLRVWELGVTDAVVAAVGLGVAWVLWRRRVDRPELEPAFLQRVWYWDDLYDLVIGRPGQALARFSATVVDSRVIDGAVNGAATAVKATGGAVRRIQTGYLRHYALAIAIGLALVIAFFVSRVWWS